MKNYLFTVLFLSCAWIGFGQEEEKLSPQQFESLFSNEFRTLSGSNSEGTGGFAELNLAEGRVEFSPSFILNNFTRIDLKASGSATDGVFSIIRDTDFNKALSFGVGVSFKINEDSKASKSFNYIKIDGTNKDLSDHNSLLKFRTTWFNINYELNYNEFKLFDSNLNYTSQLSDTSVWSQSGNISWSIYNFNNELNFRTFYFNIAARYTRANNINSLTKRNVKESRTYSDSLSQRTYNSEYVAYEGDFKSGINRLSISGNIYFFPLAKSSAAIHLSTGITIQDNLEPTYALGLGILSSIKNKDKNKPKINVELYYNLYDLTNVSESDLSQFSRNEIGFRFTFPIDFK